MNIDIKMAPNHHFMLNSLPLEPVSRTYQYRKIMKPMLERKRRARINKCLDELKELMTGTLQADGENVSKLEKADILELTVRHLHRLRENNALFLRSNETLNMEKFWAGFQHCAAEVAQFLSKYDRHISGDLIKHIASYVPNIAAAAAAVAVAATATTITTTTTATATATANYQRFSTAMNQQQQQPQQLHQQLPSNTAVATRVAATVNIATMPTKITLPTAAAAAATKFYNNTTADEKLRLHPYARAAAAIEMGFGGSVGGGGAVAGCFAMAGGGINDAGAVVWRPW